MPLFDGDPKEWVKWINSSEAIIGETGYKSMMESQEEATQEAEMDKEFH